MLVTSEMNEVFRCFAFSVFWGFDVFKIKFGEKLKGKV